MNALDNRLKETVITHGQLLLAYHRIIEAHKQGREVQLDELIRANKFISIKAYGLVPELVKDGWLTKDKRITLTPKAKQLPYNQTLKNYLELYTQGLDPKTLAKAIGNLTLTNLTKEQERQIAIDKQIKEIEQRRYFADDTRTLQFFDEMIKDLKKERKKDKGTKSN